MRNLHSLCSYVMQLQWRISLAWHHIYHVFTCMHTQALYSIACSVHSLCLPTYQASLLAAYKLWLQVSLPLIVRKWHTSSWNKLPANTKVTQQLMAPYSNFRSFHSPSFAETGNFVHCWDSVAEMTVMLSSCTLLLVVRGMWEQSYSKRSLVWGTINSETRIIWLFRSASLSV